MIPLVVVESPFAGDVEANLAYVRRALRDCIARGESPYASHALLTQPGVLDDSVPEERSLGMAAGFAFYAVAERCAVYVDRGISGGMRAGIRQAERHGVPVEYRSFDTACDELPRIRALLDKVAGRMTEGGTMAEAMQVLDGMRRMGWDREDGLLTQMRDGFAAKVLAAVGWRAR